MGIFGSGPSQRQAAVDPAAGEVYLERRPGESAEAFEARLAAAARERFETRSAAGARRPVADPAAGEVYVERRPGESPEAFEARAAAAARERSDTRAAAGARRPVAAEARRAPPPARRRRGFGFVGLFVVLVAAVGVLWLVLAAREGSFAAGGAVVDQKLAEVTSPARVAVNQAADRTGAAVQNAGQSLEAQGERLRETAK